MSWAVGSVTLPYGPIRVDIGNPAKLEDFELDGEAPIVNVVAPPSNSLSLTGSISSATDAKSTVTSTYIAPLLALRGTIVAFSDPSGLYDGDYLFDVKFTDESQGTMIRFTYTMSLRVVTSINTL